MYFIPYNLYLYFYIVKDRQQRIKMVWQSVSTSILLLLQNDELSKVIWSIFQQMTPKEQNIPFESSELSSKDFTSQPTTKTAIHKPLDFILEALIIACANI